MCVGGGVDGACVPTEEVSGHLYVCWGCRCCLCTNWGSERSSVCVLGVSMLFVYQLRKWAVICIPHTYRWPLTSSVGTQATSTPPTHIQMTVHFLSWYTSNFKVIHLRSLRNRSENLAYGSLFYLSLKLVQVNYIYFPTLYVYWLSNRIQFKHQIESCSIGYSFLWYLVNFCYF
jgi:hypothetical protein